MLLDKLRAWFDSPKEESEPTDADLRLATAALLVEMARADFEEDPQEHQAILEILKIHFDVSFEAAKDLLENAESRVDESVSLHEFTSKLHKKLAANDKMRIVAMLWEVALSDGQIDKHEDHLVRKVAELLYVNHADLVRLKHSVVQGASNRRPERR